MTVLVSTHYMDEAERCHRIAYISYGRLPTESTIKEVLDRSDRSPGAPKGRRIDAVANELRGAARLEMVAPFGSPCTSAAPTGWCSRPQSRHGVTIRGSTGGRSRPRWRTCSSTS